MNGGIIYFLLQAINARTKNVRIFAKDKDIWLSTETGSHFKLDDETGEIKAGFGGKIKHASEFKTRKVKNGKVQEFSYKTKSPAAASTSAAKTTSTPTHTQEPKISAHTAKEALHSVDTPVSIAKNITGTSGNIRQETQAAVLQWFKDNGFAKMDALQNALPEGVRGLDVTRSVLYCVARQKAKEEIAIYSKIDDEIYNANRAIHDMWTPDTKKQILKNKVKELEKQRAQHVDNYSEYMSSIREFNPKGTVYEKMREPYISEHEKSGQSLPTNQRYIEKPVTIKKETQKAYGFRDEEGHTIWLPKSRTTAEGDKIIATEEWLMDKSPFTLTKAMGQD